MQLNQLALWHKLFGTQDPNNCDLVGFDQDGTTLFYNDGSDNEEEKGTLYSDGLYLEHAENYSRLNNQEHIVAYPLIYVALMSQGMKLTESLNAFGQSDIREAAEKMFDKLKVEKED